MMAVEVPLIIDIGVDRQGLVIFLIFMQYRRRPVRNGTLVVKFRDLVIFPVIPVLQPVFPELAHNVIRHPGIHGQSFCQPGHVPAKIECRVYGIDGRPVVSCQILDENGRVRTASKQAVRIIGGSGRLHSDGGIENTVVILR